MTSRSNTSQAHFSARNPHSRGDGVRGPIICFALGLILALAGVSGGGGVADGANPVAAESAGTAGVEAQGESQCATPQAGSPCFPSQGECDGPAEPCMNPPTTGCETPVVEGFESGEDPRASGFTFFRFELQEKLESDAECYAVFALEAQAAGSQAAVAQASGVQAVDALECRIEAAMVTLGCGGA